MGRFERASILILVAALCAGASPARAAPLGTAFTYQGNLNMGGEPVDDTADFQCALYDALSGGQQIGSTIAADNVDVIDGVFAIPLDFGIDVFDGAARWLEISVRSPAGGGTLTPLSPRVPVSAAPYALQTRGIFVNDQGTVSIPPPGTGGNRPAAGGSRGNPTAQHAVTAQGTKNTAIFGKTPQSSGRADGVLGRSSSDEGRGVAGEAVSATGSTAGVLGQADPDNPDGEGVHGAGATGVGGESTADAGKGVLGMATGNGETAGVMGESTSPDGEGVHGTGTTGICGESPADAGKGVLGIATGNGETAGVMGESTSPDGEGVHGTGTTGICGESTADAGKGVLGMAAGNGETAGVMGESTSPDGEGLRGTGATGICGESTMDEGTGVLGQATGQGATKGVKGQSAAPDGEGVHGTGWTGARGISEATNGLGALGSAGDTGSAVGVRGWSSSPTGVGIHAEGATGARGLSNAAGGTGVLGEGLESGPAVLGRGTGAQTTGVRGDAGEDATGVPIAAVHGRAVSSSEEAAAVLAESIEGPLQPAALDIRNGAIRVTGGVRAAGWVDTEGPWLNMPIQDEQVECFCCVHRHVVGSYHDVLIKNDLINPDCVILVTFQRSTLAPEVYYTTVTRDGLPPGEAIVRIARYDDAPIGSFNGKIYYMIINT